MAPSFVRFFALLSLVSASAAISRPALADESEGERLFREGRALMLQERFDEACPKLEESQRLEPHGGTLLNVAACHERQGRIATAWAEFQDALTTARTEGQAARVKLAEQRIAALDPRVPWLVIRVAPEAEAQGVRVTVDGAEIVRAAWGKDMPIDPGDHLLVVTAKGRVEHRSTIALREGGKQTIEVKGLAELPAPAHAEPAEPPPAPPPSPAPPKHEVATSRFGRWVFEVGVFAAYMNGNMTRARPDVGEDHVGLVSLAPGSSETTSCYAQECSYELGRQGGFTGGVNLFAGFAAAERVHFGGRLLAGPRLGGGAIFATGPSVSINMWGPLWAGASAYVGYASQSRRAGVTPPPGYGLVQNDTYMLTGSTDAAFGLGFELRAELFRTTTGAFSLDVQPFFLTGADGSAFVIPFGVSYRFR